MFFHGDIKLANFVVANIQNVKHWPLRKKLESGEHLALVIRKFQLAQRLSCFQRFLAPQKKSLLILERSFFLLFQIFFQSLETPCDLIQVSKHQLEIEILRVAQRVHRTGGMRHHRIFRSEEHTSELQSPMYL